MRRYVVLESISNNADGGLVLVRDGFCWPMVLSLGVWMIRRGMWEVAVVVILAAAALAGSITTGALPVDAGCLLAATGLVLLGFEGYSLRVWTLQRRGFVPVSVVAADSLFQAERTVAADSLFQTERTVAAVVRRRYAPS